MTEREAQLIEAGWKCAHVPEADWFMFKKFLQRCGIKGRRQVFARTGFFNGIRHKEQQQRIRQFTQDWNAPLGRKLAKRWPKDVHEAVNLLQELEGDWCSECCGYNGNHRFGCDLGFGPF